MKAKEEFIKGKHAINWVDSNFTKEYGEDELTTGTVLKYKKLTRSMYDRNIIKEYNIQECTLGDVLETMKAATSDMKDGYSNIFYVKGHPSHVVSVSWDGGEWRVRDWGRDDSMWRAGGRVFSSATSDTGSTSTGPLKPLALPNEYCVCERCVKCKKLIA